MSPKTAHFSAGLLAATAAGIDQHYLLQMLYGALINFTSTTHAALIDTGMASIVREKVVLLQYQATTISNKTVPFLIWISYDDVVSIAQNEHVVRVVGLTLTAVLANDQALASCSAILCEACLFVLTGLRNTYRQLTFDHCHDWPAYDALELPKDPRPSSSYRTLST